METRFRYFHDGIDLDGMDLDGASPYPGEFDPGGAADDGLPLSFLPNQDMAFDTTIVKTEDAWDRTELFVDPGLYPQVNDGGVSLDAPGILNSTTPETRSSVPTESSPKSSSSKSRAKSRASKSSSASSPPPPTTATRPTRKRKPSKKAKKEEEAADVAVTKDGDDEHESKRSKFLERNRLAAHKCRQRKKEYVMELEETKLDLEAQRAHLAMELHALAEEAGRLKGYLMAHAGCKDANIDEWLTNEARRFVQSCGGRVGSSRVPRVPIPAQPRQRRGGGARLGAGSEQHNLPELPYTGVDMATGAGGDGIVYSQASSLQTSPTDVAFPRIPSPEMKVDTGLEYGEMPDSVFGPREQIFGGG